MAASLNLAVVVHCLTDQGGPDRRRGEPVTCGLPWPKGAVVDPELFDLSSADGGRELLQVKVLDRWSDGSVRWVLFDWLADVDGGAGTYTIGIRQGKAEPPLAGPLAMDFDPDGAALEFHTGKASLCFRRGGRFPFESVEVQGRPAVDVERTRLLVEDARGRNYQVVVDRLAVEDSGPVRTCVRVDARIVSPGAESLARLTARFHGYVASATIRVQLAVTNPRCAGHAGGKWSLGSAGSVFIRDATLVFALPAGEHSTVVRCSPELATPLATVALPLELYQDSSGGENWQSSSHVNRQQRIPLAFRGYRMRAGLATSRGLRATPVVVIEGEEHHLAVAMRQFWQNFPKAVEASVDTIALRLFPRQHADLHELQGGERKTHTFHLSLDRDEVTQEPLVWARAPLVAHAEPAWYAASDALPGLVPEERDPNSGYGALVRAAIEGEDTFYTKRETIDEYGWRHFGDIYADHEAVFHPHPTALVSHYNNQFDAVHGFALQFMRSGNARWFRLMEELAQHVVDIDTYHTDRDKAAYNGGQFWHTVHYIDAGTSTHRSYPRSEGVSGGGPSPGQLYSTGLMLQYFLTGSVQYLETVIQLGQYVIDADDGRKTIFRFIDRGRTGHVSASAFDDYHGPGRTSANAVDALLDAHRLTGEQKFIVKAEELIHRCIHPDDDLVARNLLDADNRWFYTMFLQTLGRYLEYKAERNETDEAYAYAWNSFLHYAKWAAANEYPYLDKPEILEFPTETWAAQDMRKCEVFNLAARLTTGSQQARFLKQGRVFFDCSVDTLGEMATRSLCRPVVILLSNGASQAAADLGLLQSLPSARGDHDFGRPTTFKSQKSRAFQRLKRLALATMIAAGAAWPTVR